MQTSSLQYCKYFIILKEFCLLIMGNNIWFLKGSRGDDMSSCVLLEM